MSNFRFGPNVSASDKWGRSTKRRRDCQALVSASYVKGEAIEYAVDVQLRDEGDGMTPQWLSLRMTPDAARELAASILKMADVSDAQRRDPKSPKADDHRIDEATATMEREGFQQFDRAAAKRPPADVDERIAAAPASVVDYETRKARAQAAGHIVPCGFDGCQICYPPKRNYEAFDDLVSACKAALRCGGWNTRAEREDWEINAAPQIKAAIAKAEVRND